MPRRVSVQARGPFAFANAVVLVLVLAVRAVSASAEPVGPGSSSTAAADSAGSLAPTSAVPWNPDRPAPAHEPWEAALNAPLTVASLPLRLVGAGLRSGLLVIQQDLWIPRVQLLLGLQPPMGIGLRPASLGDRTGTAGAVTFVPGAARGWLRASLEGSTLRYARGHVELGPRMLHASYTHDWRPQEPYFGAGMEAREADVSNYSLRTRTAEVRLRLRGGGAALRHELGAWVGERRGVTRRGRESGRPSLEAVFPALADATFDRPEDHAVAGARLVLDTRGGAPHWAHGWRVAGQAEYFGHPWSGRGVLFPGDAASPAFGRTTLEAETGVSFMRDPRTVRLAVRVVDTRVIDTTRPPAPHDLVTLGGGEGLAGFEPGRFHDLDLALARVSYLFPLTQTSEFELAAELGGVYADLWNGARLDRALPSWGVAYRLRTEHAPVVAIGLGWSRESARVRFALGGVE